MEEQTRSNAFLYSTEPEWRDDSWLAARLDAIRQNHFADVPVGYPVVTRFGVRAQYRYGSICAQKKITLILINRLFADPFVPDFVVDGTLAHEMVHYAHGFGSGLPRRYTAPHRGGIVDQELEQRGLGEVNRKAEQWRKTHWDTFYAQRCSDLVERRSQRVEGISERWERVFHSPGARSVSELTERAHSLGQRLNLVQESPPFAVEWLQATTRQTGLSYWYARSRVVRLHGLLADRRVPQAVVDCELSYWLARGELGANWKVIHARLCECDLSAIVAEAQRWKRAAWKSFCVRNHPLRPEISPK